MKAVGYQRPGPISAVQSLMDIELPKPVATGHDLLVEVLAVSVNPVDTKVRNSATPPEDAYRVLGFDAVGIVREVGEAVTLFKAGDEVWYAGVIDRPGSNSEFQLVDERIAGHRPRSISVADAAALPLTGITAYELLFDRLQVPRKGEGKKESILVVGAAGGVGSVLIQLARQLTDLTVIGTASRPETTEWVKSMGAHHVINHHETLPAQVAALNVPPVGYVVSLTHTDKHFESIVEVLRPQGRLALIDDPAPIDIRLLKRKSLSLHWELMFTRPLFKTDDMQAQHDILEELAELVDQGTVRSTRQQHLGVVNAANLKQAHSILESGTAIGKIVLEGF